MAWDWQDSGFERFDDHHALESWRGGGREAAIRGTVKRSKEFEKSNTQLQSKCQ